MQRKHGFAVVGVVLLGALAVWLGLRSQRGRAAHAVAPITAAAQGDVTAGARGPVEPTRQARAAIGGTVRERGGGPLAGAQVCATWSAPASIGGEPAEPVCAITDAAGGYQLAGLVPGRHAVIATAAAHVPAAWRGPGDGADGLTLAPEQTRTGVDLALAAGGVEVRGVVEDINGGPVAGARVTAAGEAGASVGRAATRADDQGRFVLWTGPGTIWVDARAEGYARGGSKAVAPAKAVTVLLTPASSLGGIVVEAGTRTPVADVLVAIRGDDRDALGLGGASARTDGDGRFRIERLTPGRYKPTATGRGLYGEPAESVLLGLGQRVDDLTIEVHAARTVRGRVEVAAGAERAPGAGARVSLHADDGDASVADIDGVTDDDGRVELLVVRPGRYQVSVEREGALAADHYDPIVVAGRDVDGVIWTMTGGGAIRGVVRTATGAPVGGVSVGVEPLGAGRGIRSWAFDDSRDDGSFALRGLATGDYAVRVRADEHRSPEPPPKVAVVAGRDTRADVVLEASGAIAGVVVDTAGTPVAGLDIGINNGPYFRNGRGARSDEDGRFLIGGVPAGPQRVFASRGWFEKLRLPGRTGHDARGVLVEVAVGATASVRIVVDSQSGVISGTVRDEQGRPVVDAWVLASRASDGPGAMGTRWTWDFARGAPPVITDVDGRFALRRLAPGLYTLRGFRQGGGEVVVEHVAVGATVALVIRATGSIAGTARGPGGAAVAELMVRVSDPATGFDRSESFFRTGGRFTMRDLPAGTFVVTVSGAGGRATQDVTLAAGEQRAGLAFDLVANLTVRGRVVDAVTGAPVSGMSMIVTPAKGGDPRGISTFDDTGDRASISGDDGRFEVTGVAPGTGTLEGLAVDFIESEYGMVHQPIELTAATPVVDIGDVKVGKRGPPPPPP